MEMMNDKEEFTDLVFGDTPLVLGKIKSFGELD